MQIKIKTDREISTSCLRSLTWNGSTVHDRIQRDTQDTQIGELPSTLPRETRWETSSFHLYLRWFLPSFCLLKQHERTPMNGHYSHVAIFELFESFAYPGEKKIVQTNIKVIEPCLLRDWIVKQPSWKILCQFQLQKHVFSIIFQLNNYIYMFT